VTSRKEHSSTVFSNGEERLSSEEYEQMRNTNAPFYNKNLSQFKNMMMASRSRIPFDRNVSKTAAAYNSGNILNMSQSGVKRAKYHHEHTNSHTALQKLVQNNTHRRQISYQGALNQPIQQITGPMITSGGATTLENIEPDDDSNNSQQQNMDHASTDQDKT
jgi:hypothetical protein